jgi:hypothetical protein
MSRTETIARIECANNGFIICADDPKIREKNRTSKGAYTNPEQQYVFEKFSEVLKWLKEHEEDLVPEDDEYESSFDEAAKED